MVVRLHIGRSGGSLEAYPKRTARIDRYEWQSDLSLPAPTRMWIERHGASSSPYPLMHRQLCGYIGGNAKVESMDWEPLGKPGYLINRAARAFARIGEARLKPHGFGVGHLPVLVALRNGDAFPQKKLARFARIEQPSMAQMLARMERDALIQRAPNLTDRRSSLISLTNDALARLPAVRNVLIEGNREALDGFSEEDAETLAVLLQRLLANLERIEDRQESRS